MMRHDDARRDDVAALALGILPAREAEAVAAHVRGCDECGAEYADLRTAADAVAYGAELAPGDLDELASARMKARVMAVVRATPRAAAAAPVARRTRPPAAAGRAGFRWAPYLATAAAVAVALVSTTDLVQQRAHTADLEARSVALESAASAANGRVAMLVAPDLARFPVPGGTVLRAGGRLALAMRELPALPAGKVYQAWTLARGAHAVAPNATFAPAGSGTTFVMLDRGAADVAAVAVSVEPAGGSTAPTTKPSFVRTLS